MSDNKVLFKEFLKSASAIADGIRKEAAPDKEALYGIKDPNNKGEATIPGCLEGSNRSALGLPENCTNLTEPNKDHHIMSVTNPNGVGQGEYITPRCGTERDERVKSPTEPLSKMARIAEMAAGLKAQYAEKQAAPQYAPQPSAPAAALPSDITQDQDLMSKLASMAAVALGTEAGRAEFAKILERSAGIKEASAIVTAAAQATQEAQYAVKQASAQAELDAAQNAHLARMVEFSKQAHAAWQNCYETDMEKLAYAAGAEDANATADAVEAGADPSIPGAGDEGLTDDEILQVLGELVQSGQVSQEDAEAILQAAGESANDGLDPEEFAAALQAAVQSGEIDPETAAAIAEQAMGGGMAAGGTPAMSPEEAAAAADPAVAAAANEAVEKAASVVNYLWGAQ